ncbi:hypothetical protein [Shewanella baltica]|uniref:hypothetical protein n=2 Tax=Shewanella TaxID=22 RepID=UPI001F41F6E2|nr:hypothetical protein [Shewanella baltica]
MMDFFDIGFYYADWGQVNAYIKLPAGTIPCDFKAINADFYVSFVENKQNQLLIFTLEDDYRYRDDESAESFMLHLVALRTELLTGDYRALYFHWLSQANDDMALEPLPLITFDFHQLTQAQLAFTTLFDIPLPSIRALHLLLQSMPAHVPQPKVLTAQQQVAKLTDAEKDALLCRLFDEGKIFAADAYVLLRTQETPIEYSHWVTVASLHPFWHVAEKEVMQEDRMAEAERLARETLLRNEHLEAVYKAHQSHWDSAFEEAARGCASGYDNAGRTLQVLFDAYQLKQSSSEFKQNFDVFISKNKQRKALIKRLEPLQKIMLSL